MTLTEALELFKLDDSAQINEETIKKAYRTYCFMYHPDAHPNENPNIYEDMMAKINEAYNVLKKYIAFNNIKGKLTESEVQANEKQTVKEKILMDIIVRAYYASKNEIDEVNSEFLDMFLSVPQQVGNIRRNGKPIVGYPHIHNVFVQKAKIESEIMKKYIEKFVKEFAQKYGIEINLLDAAVGEYINFLNNTDWYEKYKKYKDQENSDIKRLR